MKKRPILFSAPMVRALLAGKKTQTRRVIKPVQPRNDGMWPAGRDPVPDCPHGKVGDYMWVRETLRSHGHFGFPLGEMPQLDAINRRIWSYAADEIPDHTGTRVSIHMPRWASRIMLEITGVRVERLRDIGEDDACAEGCNTHGMNLRPAPGGMLPCVQLYSELWESINGPGSWNANPWVWVLEFKRITP